MNAIDPADAKAHLSEFVDRVEADDSIDTTRRGKPVARLTAAIRPRKILFMAASSPISSISDGPRRSSSVSPVRGNAP